MGSTSSFTPFDSMTASVEASPSPSSIMSPYWKPEQPPPWTNTRRPASSLFSSVRSSEILVAAVGVTLIMILNSPSDEQRLIIPGWHGDRQPTLGIPPSTACPAWVRTHPAVPPSPAHPSGSGLQLTSSAVLVECPHVKTATWGHSILSVPGFRDHTGAWRLNFSIS